MNKLYWVGRLKADKNRFIFTSIPTKNKLEVFCTYCASEAFSENELNNLKKQYKFIVGPFKTEDGAKHMASGCQQCKSINEAELHVKSQNRSYISGR